MNSGIESSNGIAGLTTDYANSKKLKKHSSSSWTNRRLVDMKKTELLSVSFRIQSKTIKQVKIT